MARNPLTLLGQSLEDYKKVLEELADSSQPEMLLNILLLRNQVEIKREQIQAQSTQDVQQAAPLFKQLVELDGELRKQTIIALSELSDWRETFQPPDGYWWWFLDQAAEEREAENDLPWLLLTGTLFSVLTIPVALDIIKRLWDGTPDVYSGVGTLLISLLTVGPLIEHGRELGEWFLKPIIGQKRHLQAKTMSAIAFIVFGLVLTARLVGVPWLAQCYYDRGIDLLVSKEENDEWLVVSCWRKKNTNFPAGSTNLFAGNLTKAERSFQRAVALDADVAPAYYHLGLLYEEIARPDKAITWYQQAREHDLDLHATYKNLGRLYILQGQPEQAEPLFLAGLRRTSDNSDHPDTDLVIRYQLLSNLGWAYYVLDDPEQARSRLEEAISLESKLKSHLKSAVPHYYLALIYEALEQPDKALEQWEDSLRYLNKHDPEQIGWDKTIRTHQNKLEKKDP